MLHARECREAFREDDEIIFAPDKYFAHYTSTRTRRDFISWKEYCPTRVKILPKDIAMKNTLYKNTEGILHRKCPDSIISLADKVLSTEGIFSYEILSFCVARNNRQGEKKFSGNAWSLAFYLKRKSFRIGSNYKTIMRG